MNKLPGDDLPAGTDARVRRDGIRARVVEQGSARIEELAEAFGVSAMTVHRDLDRLESEGWLRKIRGGATAEPSALHHGDVRHRGATMVAAKAALAAAALRLVEPGRSVMLDDSTTALALARRLPERAPLTVVTNFLPAITVVAAAAGLDLIALGGSHFPAYDAFLGPSTAAAVCGLRADVLFCSTTAIAQLACYHQSPETVAVKRAMLESADRRVLLVDHTKFARSGLHRLAALAEFDDVVVDADTAPEDLAAMRAAGVALTVA